MRDTDLNNNSIRIAKILSISCLDKSKGNFSNLTRQAKGKERDQTIYYNNHYLAKIILYIDYEDFTLIKDIKDENLNNYKILRIVVSKSHNKTSKKKNKLTSYLVDFSINSNHSYDDIKPIEDEVLSLGQTLFTKQKNLPKLSDDSYYYNELIGLKLYFNKDKLGEVVSVANFGASDLLQIELRQDFDYKAYTTGLNKELEVQDSKKTNKLKSSKETIYLPFDEDMFLKVDKEGKKIYLKSLVLLASYVHIK